MTRLSSYKGTIYNTADVTIDTGATDTVLYDSEGVFPGSTTTGTHGLSLSTGRFYVFDGDNWKKIIQLPDNPIQLDNVSLSGFSLSKANYFWDSAAGTATINVSDPDSLGQGSAISYTFVTGGSFDSYVTVSQDAAVFTLTLTDSNSAATGTIIFKADDGLDIVNSSTFSFLMTQDPPIEAEVWDGPYRGPDLPSGEDVNVYGGFLSNDQNNYYMTGWQSAAGTAIHNYDVSDITNISLVQTLSLTGAATKFEAQRLEMPSNQLAVLPTTTTHHLIKLNDSNIASEELSFTPTGDAGLRGIDLIPRMIGGVASYDSGYYAAAGTQIGVFKVTDNDSSFSISEIDFITSAENSSATGRTINLVRCCGIDRQGRFLFTVAQENGTAGSYNSNANQTKLQVWNINSDRTLTFNNETLEVPGTNISGGDGALQVSRKGNYLTYHWDGGAADSVKGFWIIDYASNGVTSIRNQYSDDDFNRSWKSSIFNIKSNEYLAIGSISRALKIFNITDPDSVTETLIDSSDTGFGNLSYEYTRSLAVSEYGNTIPNKIIWTSYGRDSSNQAIVNAFGLLSV